MATIVAPVHRQHALWLRVLEDLALILAVSFVGWTLFATLGLHQSPWQAVSLPVALAGQSVPSLPEPVSLVPASRPMMAAVAAATNLEEQGVFSAETQAAWGRALAECRRFSVQPIATAQGQPIMLWLLEPERERAAELAARIAAADTPAEEIEALTALRDEAVANAAVIERYREIVNFDYWRAVCEEGASATGLAMREQAWKAGLTN